MIQTMFICQIYLYAMYRSYGERALKVITELLPLLKESGFSGVYLIALFRDGGADHGFDVVSYTVNPKFGSEEDLDRLIAKAHELEMTVIVDVVPNHVSIMNPLAQNCIKGVEGFENALYIVSEEEAKELTKRGVPSFFGKYAFSQVADGVFAYTPFADYVQPANNFECEEVRSYYENVFRALKLRGVDGVRVDCGMMVLPDFSKADPNNPLAIFNPARSIKAIRDVANGMPLFYEWFDPSSAGLFEPYPECWALDCEFVMNPHPAMEWNHPKIVPLAGGHDQATAADNGYDIDALIAKMRGSQYAFLDIATLLHWRNDPHPLPGDALYDASYGSPQRRHLGRRPAGPMVDSYITKRPRIPV